MGLVELISKVAGTSAPMSEEAFRYAWEAVKASKDRSSMVSFIRREDAPEDLVVEFSKLNSPLELRAAYLSRPGTSEQELFAALESESRIGVWRALAKFDFTPASVLAHLCSRRDFATCLSVYHHPNADLATKLAALPTLVENWHKLTGTPVGREIMAFCGTDPEAFKVAVSVCGIPVHDLAQALTRWALAMRDTHDPRLLSDLTTMTVSEQQALAEVLTSEHFADRALDPEPFVGLISDRKVAHWTVRRLREHLDPATRGATAAVQAAAALVARHGDPHRQVVDLDSALERARNGNLESKFLVMRHPDATEDMVVEMLSEVCVPAGVADVHGDKPRVVSLLLVLGRVGSFSGPFAALSVEGRRTALSFLDRAIDMVPQVSVHLLHVRLSQLAASGAIDKAVIGAMPARLLPTMQRYAWDLGRVADLLAVVTEWLFDATGGDPGRIELLDALLDGFPGTLEDLIGTIDSCE